MGYIAVLAALAALAGAGALYQAIGAARGARRFAAPGEWIDVGVDRQRAGRSTVGGLDSGRKN